MAREIHFVCEHLENVSRAALEKYQDIVRHHVRRRQGVYALYRRGKLYYVGLASNLRSRLHMHLRDRHCDSWDRFSVYLTKSDTHLRELEAMVLRIVRPKGNKQIGRFARSADIRRKFARDIRERQRGELRALMGKFVDTKESANRLGAEETNGRGPVLAAHITGPMSLRARYKGKLIHARVRRDGKIRLNGNLYDSPSLAAAAACQRRSCNGWKFWQYERAGGDWVPLDELRR